MEYEDTRGLGLVKFFAGQSRCKLFGEEGQLHRLTLNESRPSADFYPWNIP